MRATLKDIAREVGVSTSLVSLYLNKHPLSAKIAGKTKQKIDEAVKKLDYRPSAAARALRKGKSKTIALITGDISGGFSSFMAQSVLNEMDKFDYQLLISVTNFNREKERKCLQNMLDRQADGIIYHLNYFSDPEMDERLRNYPFVQMSSRYPAFCDATVDYEEGLRQSFDVITQQGIKDVVFASHFFRHEWNTVSKELCQQYQIAHRTIDPEDDITTFNERLARRNPELFVSYSWIFIHDFMRYCREHNIVLQTRFIYSYTLPFNYIDSELVLGVIRYNFKDFIERNVAKIIDLIENPGQEISHIRFATDFLTPQQIRHYHKQQTDDPYYRGCYKP